MEDPSTEIQQQLKQLISAAKEKKMQRKLSHIIEPEYKPMTYIEIPNKEWYHSAETDKIYEFDVKYTTTSIQKKTTLDSRVIKVNEDKEAIIWITEKPSDIPTWTK